MYTDAQNRPSFNQSLVGSGTIVSTDSVDLLTANRNIGRSGGSTRAVAHMTAALAGATAIQVQLITSANANLSSPTIVASSAAVPVASAGLGAKVFDMAVPGTAQRYIGFQYVLTGTGTGGTISSHLVAETDNQPYPAMNTGL